MLKHDARMGASHAHLKLHSEADLASRSQRLVNEFNKLSAK